MEGKKKLQVLTLEKRISVIRDNENGLSQRILAAKYNCGKTQIHKTIANKKRYLDEWESNANKGYKRKRKCVYETVNGLVWEWFQTSRANGVQISGPMIQEKAREYAQTLGNSTLTASNGWLESFRKRHCLVYRTLGSQSFDVDILTEDAVDCDDISLSAKETRHELVSAQTYDESEAESFLKVEMVTCENDSLGEEAASNANSFKRYSEEEMISQIPIKRSCNSRFDQLALNLQRQVEAHSQKEDEVMKTLLKAVSEAVHWWILEIAYKGKATCENKDCDQDFKNEVDMLLHWLRCRLTIYYPSFGSFSSSISTNQNLPSESTSSSDVNLPSQTISIASDNTNMGMLLPQERTSVISTQKTKSKTRTMTNRSPLFPGKIPRLAPTTGNAVGSFQSTSNAVVSKDVPYIMSQIASKPDRRARVTENDSLIDSNCQSYINFDPDFHENEKQFEEVLLPHSLSEARQLTASAEGREYCASFEGAAKVDDCRSQDTTSVSSSSSRTSLVGSEQDFGDGLVLKSEIKIEPGVHESDQESEKIIKMNEDEDHILLRKRQLAKERKARWLAKQSQETLAGIRAAGAAAARNRRARETTEQLQSRRNADAVAHRNRRAQETFEQSQARRNADAESQRIRRAQETMEQSQARRNADAAGKRNRKTRETSEQVQPVSSSRENANLRCGVSKLCFIQPFTDQTPYFPRKSIVDVLPKSVTTAGERKNIYSQLTSLEVGESSLSTDAICENVPYVLPQMTARVTEHDSLIDSNCQSDINFQRDFYENEKQFEEILLPHSLSEARQLTASTEGREYCASSEGAAKVERDCRSPDMTSVSHSSSRTSLVATEQDLSGGVISSHPNANRSCLVLKLEMNVEPGNEGEDPIQRKNRLTKARKARYIARQSPEALARIRAREVASARDLRARERRWNDRHRVETQMS